MHRDTVLVVIDTLQKVRISTAAANPYANDYQDLSSLKALADRYRIAILAIHHIRKMQDDDPFNRISGTTGISGVADTNLVLLKQGRSGVDATLHCVGRDVEYQELHLQFQNCRWLLTEPLEEPKQEPVSAVTAVTGVTEKAGQSQYPICCHSRHTCHRRSQEDERQGESNSIHNQRLLLEQYARENGFQNTLFLADDGYSGTNFERPSADWTPASPAAGQGRRWPTSWTTSSTGGTPWGCGPPPSPIRTREEAGNGGGGPRQTPFGFATMAVERRCRLMAQIYGYIRVSSKDQNEERQRIALEGQGIPEKNLYFDRQSGKDFNRPAYRRMLKRLRQGDLLLIKSIDRLGRNYEEILEQWRLLTKEKRVRIRVLDMPLLDAGPRRDLTETLIADIVLQLLSYVAQTERENIRQRQAEGIAAAKARGVRFGPGRAELPAAFEEAYRAYRRGALSVRKAAELAGMKKSTFYRECQRRAKKTVPESLPSGTGSF